jgi:predicted RNase H-like HicB family nuclease
MSQYVVVIHRAEEGGYWAEVPALPGCFAQGETVDEVLADAEGAVVSHLEALSDDGQEPPPPGDVFIATISTGGRAA